MDKAHVQHPVGLVQDEDLHLGQVQQALAGQVQQAAGGGGENVHPPLELVHLGGLAHPAEDHRLGEGQVLAVGVEGLVNLNGQLPGGGENQGPDRSPLHAVCGLSGVIHSFDLTKASVHDLPDRYPDFDVLTPTLQELFRRAFQYGASDPEVRPTAKEFSDALEDYIESLEYCECSGWDHYLRKDYNKPYCEWCRVEHEYGQKRNFYPKNIPYMNDNELEYCMKIDLSDHYKTLIRKELKKRQK